MNSNMVKPEKFGHLHLVSRFPAPLRPVSDVFFCMQVKTGPSLQKTCHELKDVTI